MSEPKYYIHDGQVIFADKYRGAVLQPNEMWYPFVFVNDGELDVWSIYGFIKPSTAYKMAKIIK